MRVSLREASAKFGPSIASLRARIATGQLRGFRLHPKGKIFIEADELQQLMQRVAPPPMTDVAAWKRHLDVLYEQTMREVGERPRRSNRSHAPSIQSVTTRP